MSSDGVDNKNNCRSMYRVHLDTMQIASVLSHRHDDMYVCAKFRLK